MKIITAAALAAAALLTTALPASADDGPIDFGFFQGVNDTKASGPTASTPTWKQADNGPSETTPQTPLTMLADSLGWPG
jgi:hypothetical protein